MENEVKSKLLKVSSYKPKFINKSIGLSLSEPLSCVNRVLGYSSVKAHCCGSSQFQKYVEVHKYFNSVELVNIHPIQGKLKKKGVSFADDPKGGESSLRNSSILSVCLRKVLASSFSAPSFEAVTSSSASSSQFSGGSILYCDPPSNSGVRQGNKIFWRGSEREMASKIWKFIKDLGVVGKGMRRFLWKSLGYEG